MQAVVGNEIDVVKYAVENGANVNGWDYHALKWSCSEGYFEIVKYLVQNGANIQASFNASLQPSSFYGHFEIVKFLIFSGAIPDKYCLLAAAKTSRYEIFSFLLIHFPCNATLKQNLHSLLEQRNFSKIIEFLKKLILDFGF